MFKRRFLFIVLVLAVVSTGLWLRHEPEPQAPITTQAAVDQLQISFLDVGQGDAILIQTPEHQKILIDGGDNSNKLLNVLGSELGWLDKKLDYVILTHPHADHVAGLNGLFGRFQISQAWGTLVNHTASTYQFWLNNLAGYHITLTPIFSPHTLSFDSGVKLEVLSPTSDLANQNVSNLNNSSLVIMLTYGQTKFLLTGDAEAEVEKDLLARGVNLQAQVLKVAHHGSSTATSQEFLDAVRPQIAVISVGLNNDFGHPHARTLNRLERAGIMILRTDQLGTIRLSSNGQELTVLK